MIDKKKIGIVCFLLILSGLLSVALQYRNHNIEKRANLPFHLPMDVAGWRGHIFSATMPSEVEPGDFILRAYRGNDGRTINMLALYSRIANYHPPALCYQGAGHQLSEIPPIASTSGKIRLAGLMGKRPSASILVYHGFYIGGKIIPDGVGKKLYEVKEKLINGSIQQYFFEVTIHLVDDDALHASLQIKRFLDDVEAYLIHPQN